MKKNLNSENKIFTPEKILNSEKTFLHFVFFANQSTIKITFRIKLLKKIEIKTGLSIQQIEFNNEYFLDCAGELECLNYKFLVRVVELCKLDEKITGQSKAIKIFNKLSVSLAIQTQKNTARAFGNMKLVHELDKAIKNYKF